MPSSLSPNIEIILSRFALSRVTDCRTYCQKEKKSVKEACTFQYKVEIFSFYIQNCLLTFRNLSGIISSISVARMSSFFAMPETNIVPICLAANLAMGGIDGFGLKATLVGWLPPGLRENILKTIFWKRNEVLEYLRVRKMVQLASPFRSMKAREISRITNHIRI